MRVDRGTLSPIDTVAAPVTVSDVTVLRDDRSRHSLVLRIPEHAFDDTPLRDRPGSEAGAPIALSTPTNEEYEGFVEVVAEATDSRIYWCGVTAK